MQIFINSIVYKNDTILLLQRNEQQSFGAGLYALPGGKVEVGERALQAMQRELKEEIGVDVEEVDLKLVHTIHRKGVNGECIVLFFKINGTNFNPFNNEADKHNHIAWFNLNKIPKVIISAHEQAIKNIEKNILYSEHGWTID